MVWPPACRGQGGPASLCWRADRLTSHLWVTCFPPKDSISFQAGIAIKRTCEWCSLLSFDIFILLPFPEKKNICWLVMGVSKVVGSVWEKKVSYCLQLVQQWPAQNWQLPDGSRNYRRHGKLWNSMQLKFLPSKWVHVDHRVWKRITMLRLLTK